MIFSGAILHTPEHPTAPHGSPDGLILDVALTQGAAAVQSSFFRTFLPPALHRATGLVSRLEVRAFSPIVHWVSATNFLSTADKLIVMAYHEK